MASRSRDISRRNNSSIIEHISAENYWQFLRERIFQPLGMNSSARRAPSIIVTNRVDGYEHSRSRGLINRDYDITDIFAAGAIVSTVEDLSRWNNALDTDKLLSRESKQLMWTPTKLNNGKETDYRSGSRRSRCVFLHRILAPADFLDSQELFALSTVDILLSPFQSQKNPAPSDEGGIVINYSILNQGLHFP